MPHPHIVSATRRLLLTGGTASAVLALFGCGGGGGSDGPVVGGGALSSAGSFASGPILGFGSIIVGNVHFEDNVARIVHDAGDDGSRADLRLGMVVEVNGSDITDDSAGRRNATAATISVRSEIKGPISAIDAAAGTLTVLGQPVRVSASTVFDDGISGGLTGLATNQIVEVYGLLNAQDQVVATRIEREDSTSRFKLRGVIRDLDAVARRFRIGGVQIFYGDLAPQPSGLANGQFARVEVLTTPDAGGIWRASRVETAATSSRLPSSGGARVELEGFITAFTSSTRFSVGGVDVDASGAPGLPAGLALGRRVEVKGALSNGVVLAREVELEDDDRGAEIEREFEVKGFIDVVDRIAQTLVVRGVTVNYANAAFAVGSAVRLVRGQQIEVQGRLSSDGRVLIAQVIEFED